MTVFFTVLEIVTPVFVLAMIGFGWVRLGYDYPVAFVTQLAMKIAVPCLVFSALARTTLSPAAIGEMAFASAIGYGVIFLAFFFGTKAMGLSSKTYAAPLIFGNTGNLGLPLALFAFGSVGLDYAVVFLSVGVIWQFTIGLWVVAGGANPSRVLKEPMVIAAILGGVFLWQGWHAPKVVSNTVELLGQMAIPIMLITLGVAIAQLSPGKIRQAFGLSIGKAILCAGVGFGLAWALGLEPEARGVLVMQLSMPVAVTSYLIAQKYNVGGSDVAGLVVISTLLSIITLPLLLVFLL